MANVPPPGLTGSWPRILDISQIASAWEMYGGAKAHVVVAVAVCLAESGGNHDAISPSADYGLWQINAANFAALGLTKVTALEVAPNVRAAIRMSGNGTNWAAWCTCWVNPARDCGHGSLAYPQPGSPADAELPRAVAQLGGSAGGSAPPPPTAGLNRTRTEWAHLNYMVGPWARGTFSKIKGTQSLSDKLGTQ